MAKRNLQEIGDDLAYLRSLAEAGAGGPAAGGGILAAAGTIFGAASLATWLLLQSAETSVPWTHLTIWGVAVPSFLLSLMILRRRMRTAPGAGSQRNQALGSAWTMISVAIFVLWAAFMAGAWRLQEWGLMGMFPSVIFALYGAGWGVAARIFHVRWVSFVAAGSLACSIAAAFLVGDNLQHLLSAAGLLAFAAVPGFVLVRHEPQLSS